MYNFSNIAEFIDMDTVPDPEREKGKGEGKGRGKPTVEFRQHECTIDAKAAGRWVRFIEGVVRKAETLAVLDHLNPLNRSDDGDGLGYGGGKGSGNSDTNGCANSSACFNRDGNGFGTRRRQANAADEDEDIHEGLGFEVYTDIRRFCTWIGLDEEQGEYWVDRRQRFAGTRRNS